MDKLVFKAPAKLNLSLDIVGIREDGYHLLEMIMQTIDLFDQVVLERADQITLTCDNPELPCDRGNLAFRAAETFFAHTGISNGVTISLTKNIPHGAGMGGGSADAAAVLNGLNQLYQTQLTTDQLCKIGLQLGADVPYCILGGTMLACGVGEILTELPILPDCTILVAKPDQGINTAQAYKAYDSISDVIHPDTTGLIEQLSAQNLAGLCKKMGNVLEYAVTLPDIDLIKQTMIENGALGSKMTGSGSAVFGIFDDPTKANICEQILNKCYAQVYLCHPCKK